MAKEYCCRSCFMKSLLLVLQTCLTAHYGLWKGCTKTLWVADIDPERESCGPAELPGGDWKIYWLHGWLSVWYLGWLTAWTVGGKADDWQENGPSGRLSNCRARWTAHFVGASSDEWAVHLTSWLDKWCLARCLMAGWVDCLTNWLSHC